MSLAIDILSGLGDKSPAAIVVTANGRRLLLDAGGALHPGDPTTWARGLAVDAVIISHDHIDHIGGVSELDPETPLYCTPLVASALPKGRAWQPLPERGTCWIEGIPVTTGQAGHSLGGVWIHLGVEGGIFYSGDACLESRLFPFDVPPSARIALLDASYGTYDQPQQACVDAISEHLNRPLVFPVPESGRALEMALWLASEADARGLSIAVDPSIRANLKTLLELPATLRRPGADEAIAALLAREDAATPSLRLISDRDDTAAQWPGYQLLHTGYLTPSRCAELAADKILWQRWNVHLRASHLVALADQVGACQVVPLFTSLAEPGLSAWRALLGPRLHALPTLHTALHPTFHLEAWSPA
ncbi:beta-lactamase family protein [Vreelandella songnenensis]|uniref:Beta-lactamase family protein n=1 Tax=Vreelandella songnenensis TaxID=1176243 RepID=A0A2T0V1Z7_9GAMM|nr:MBL fold metallo-hydrolase [Halomonas songnenensis]PRY64203.1 beta-lactamase family protein [Halomonas songnenensis]